MIDHLRHMAVFAHVVDEGSFRAAAKALGVAPSRVSQTVSDLEAFLGITLLYRTTRKIALTNEGRIFHARVVEMLHSAEAGLNELNALALEPVGALRISVPAFMSSSGLSTAIAQFLSLHPNVALTVSYSDRPVGLIEDGFDLNIRVGWLEDSAMMSRKLGEIERVLASGVEYAKARPTPKHPKDLEEWGWIRYAQRSDVTEFMSKSGRIAKVTGTSQLEVDSIDALYHMTSQNVGATVLPRHLAERGIATGDFVRLLPDWSLRPLGIFAVWPDSSRRENLTVFFVRFLAEHTFC